MMDYGKTTSPSSAVSTWNEVTGYLCIDKISGQWIAFPTGKYVASAEDVSLAIHAWGEGALSRVFIKTDCIVPILRWAPGWKSEKPK
jgi:hypothetical protein